MRKSFLAFIAIFVGSSLLASQEPLVPENIAQAICNICVDENYQQIEQYTAVATPKQLIDLYFVLENHQQEIQRIKTIMDGLYATQVGLTFFWWMKFAALSITSVKNIDKAIITRITNCLFHLGLAGLVHANSHYWSFYDKQLERIAQLRYAIKLAGIAA
jgi:hypothetical protein